MNIVLAYLDAGTGSLLLQALMGGFAGLMVVGNIALRSVFPKFFARSAEEQLLVEETA
jgi:hypothetical protein